MKDKNTHIDQLFQQELTTAEFAVNDSDWSAIQGKMKAKRKRRLLWWLPVVLLVASITTWAFWPENTEDIIGEQNELKNAQLLNSTTANQHKGAVQYNKPKTPVSGDDLSVETVTSTQSTTARIKETSYQSTANHSNQSSKQNISASQNPVKSLSNQKGDLTEVTSNVNQIAFTKLNSIQTIQFPTNAIGKEVGTTNEGLFAISALSTSNINPTRLIRWSLGAQLGLQSTQWANPVVLNENSKQQKPIYTPRLGLNANMHWSNWSLSSGLGYQASGQRGGQYKRELYDSIPVRNPQGDTIGFFRKNYRDSIVQDDQMQFKAQYLTVPLHIGYQFNLSNKIKLGVQAGITYNRLLGVSGQLTDANGYLMSEEATASAFGKQYFDWNTQLSVAYKLKNIQLGVNGGIGQSITDPGGSLPNNYQWKQWNTGVFIKYSLPKKRTGL